MHACECLLGFGREVVLRFGEDWQGQGADAEVGGDGLGCAGSGVGDGDALVGRGDLDDGRFVVDDVAERFCEAVCDAIHAADGLEHGGLPVDLLFVELAGGHVGGEELGEVEWLVQNGFGRACARACDEACAGGAGVAAILAEVAEVFEEVAEAPDVFFGELVVEGVLVDGFGEELGEVAAGVVDDLALLDGFAVVELGRLHEGGAGGVDFDFEGDAEFVTVAEDVGMDGGDACGASVEIAAVLPVAGLRGAVGELDFGAFADGPIASSGAIAGFEDGAVEAGFAELVGGGHAGDACAEDDDFFAFAEVGGELRKWRLADGGHEAERLHGGECGGVAADLGDALKEDTSGQAHYDGSEGS